LHHCGDEKSGTDTVEPILRYAAEGCSETFSGHALDSLAHDLHPEKEKTETPQNLEKNGYHNAEPSGIGLIPIASGFGGSCIRFGSEQSAAGGGGNFNRLCKPVRKTGLMPDLASCDNIKFV
jgi:hypothetical protein